MRDHDGNPVLNALGQDAYNLKRASDPDQSLANGRESVLGAGSARYEPLVTGGQYAAWYPEQGGNVYIGVQGNMRAATRGIASGPELSDKRGSGWMSGGYTGTWLWRQGGEDLGQRTAWWINFGTYVPTAFYSSIRQPGVTIEGFTGIGALGGGNVDVAVGGDAGIRESPAAHPPSVSLIATAWCWRWEARDGSRRTAPASRRAGRPQPEGERRVESRGDVQLRCRRRRQWRGHERHERRADEPARRSGRVCT